jgi:hypothetical protein
VTVTPDAATGVQFKDALTIAQCQDLLTGNTFPIAADAASGSAPNVLDLRHAVVVAMVRHPQHHTLHTTLSETTPQGAPLCDFVTPPPRLGGGVTKRY